MDDDNHTLAMVRDSLVLLAKLLTLPILAVGVVFAVGLALTGFLLVMALAVAILFTGPVLMIVGASIGGIEGAIVFVFGLGLFGIILTSGNPEASSF